MNKIYAMGLYSNKIWHLAEKQIVPFLVALGILLQKEKQNYSIIRPSLIRDSGNFVTGLFAAIALYKPNGDFKRFWYLKHFQH